MSLNFNIKINKHDLKVSSIIGDIFFDVESGDDRIIVIGKPVHVRSSKTYDLFFKEICQGGKYSCLFDYFGEFCVVNIKDGCIEIITTSATHGFYFVDLEFEYSLSNDFSLCANSKFKVNVEQCFLYVVQNINLDPFHTFYEEVKHVPGLCLAKFDSQGVSVSSLHIPICKQVNKDEILEKIDCFGMQSKYLYKNPVFSVSGGIDGISLAVAYGIHNNNINLINGYEAEYERTLINEFANSLSRLGVSVGSRFGIDQSYNENFITFYGKIIKSNWIAPKYKLRCVDNEVKSWIEHSTVINGYGVDESYEWFRPMGLAYSTVNAGGVMFNVDYFLSKVHYKFKILTFKIHGLSQVFETSKIYAGNAADLFDLKSIYNEMLLNRISRVLKVASGGVYNYSLDVNSEIDVFHVYSNMNATEKFIARYYFANTVHLIRFDNIYSNPRVESSQPWEFMPFVKLFANLKDSDKSLFYPKQALFDYMKIKRISYIDILKITRNNCFSFPASRFKRSLLYVSLKSVFKKLFRRHSSRSSLISKDERDLMIKILSSANFRPQNLIGVNLRMKEYFDYLDRSIFDTSFTTCASAHELRNYVHLCHLLSK